MGSWSVPAKSVIFASRFAAKSKTQMSCAIAALVSLPRREFAFLACVRDLGSVRGETPERRLVHHELLQTGAVGRDEKEPREPAEALSAGAEHDLVPRGVPADDLIEAGVKCHSRDISSVGAHHIDIGVPVVLAGKSDPLAVGGEFREPLFSVVERQPRRRAPGGGNRPDVLSVDKNDRPLVDVRKPHQGPSGALRSRDRGDPQRQHGRKIDRAGPEPHAMLRPTSVTHRTTS